MTDLELFDVLSTTVQIISRSEYGRVFVLKGGTVLVSKMIEANRIDLFRRTSDIDVHCNNMSIWHQFCSDVEALLNAGTTKYRYTLVKRRALTKPSSKSDSLTFAVLRLHDGANVNIKIDVNIKSNGSIIVDFSNSLQMNTYAPEIMLSDKVCAVSSEKVYRRIKDLYDICVFLSLYDFKYSDVLRALRLKHGDFVLTNMLVPSNMHKLSHAYSKFSGIINKPDFSYIVSICQRFLFPLYINQTHRDMIWDRRKMAWEYL